MESSDTPSNPSSFSYSSTSGESFILDPVFENDLTTWKLKYTFIVLFAVFAGFGIFVTFSAGVLYYRTNDFYAQSMDSGVETFSVAYMNGKSKRISKYLSTEFSSEVAIPPEGRSFSTKEGNTVLVYPDKISRFFEEEYECYGECMCCSDCFSDDDCKSFDICEGGKCTSKYDGWRRSTGMTTDQDSSRRNALLVAAGAKVCYNVGRVFAMVLASAFTVKAVRDSSLRKECDTHCQQEFHFAESNIVSPVSTSRADDVVFGNVDDWSRARERKRNVGTMIIDVRTNFEFKNGHVLGAVNIPVDEILYNRHRLPADLSEEIIVYCAAGIRAASAKDKLHSFGFKNVRNMGGFVDMLEAGHPGE